MYLQSSFRTKVRRYLNIIVPLLGIAIILFMLSLVYFWETNGRELYFYKEVVVLNQDVTRGTIITEDMLTKEKYEVDKIIDNAIINAQELIDLEAKHFIPQYTQLHPLYFENKELVTPQNTYFARIPKDWLYSIPNTLRRKDKILLYLTMQGEDSQDIEPQNINTYGSNQVDMIKQKAGSFLFETKVAYVKDSVNREIKTISKEGRLDGSSIIAEVIILTTPEQLQLLEEGVRKGGKIIILYSEGDTLYEDLPNK